MESRAVNPGKDKVRTPPLTIIDYQDEKCSGCELLDKALKLLDQIGLKLSEAVESQQ